MKIKLQPDPENIEAIRKDYSAVKLAKALLKGFGLSETDCANWDQPHKVDVNPNGTIQLKGMTCYLPDEVKTESLWNWSVEPLQEGRLIWFSKCCFFAELSNTGLVAKLPETLLNLSIFNWPFKTLDFSFAYLIHLKSLDLSYTFYMNSPLRDVSALTNLSQLTTLNLSGCKSLRDISALASLSQLTTLDLSGCKSLRDISALASLSQLTTLDLAGCESLSDVSVLANLSQLTSLKLSYCESLSDLSGLANLTQLTTLDLAGCESLSDVSVLANLSQLTSLKLSNCSSLSDINALGELKQLTSLKLLYCESLSDVSVLANLSQLTSLKLSNCSSLSDINALGELKQLTSLELLYCGSLSDINALGELKQLTSLELSYCGSLSDINALGELKQLTSLELSSCSSLSDINALGELKHLTSLELSYCESLSDVSVLANLSQLTSLKLSSRSSLSDINALGELKHLTSLELSNCSSLSDINALGELKQLTSLNLSYCESLSDISPLGELTKLAALNLLECRRITKFPNFKRLTQLRELDVVMHPAAVVDIFAHCALLRKDWLFIGGNKEKWLNEFHQAIQTNHTVAADLAISLAMAIPHLQDLASSSRLMEILHSGHMVSHVPWKHLFQGTVENSSFPALVELTNELPHDEWTCGAIGGVCALLPLLKADPDSLAWAQQIILVAHQLHQANPAYLRPIAAQWCLGLQELGEEGLLTEWLDLFTDPGDSSTLDAIYLQFGKQALAIGDVDQAIKHTIQIHRLQIRDKSLLDIAEHYLVCGEAAQVGSLLFLMSYAQSRSVLVRKLAAVPGYLDDRANLQRLLAACGIDGEKIQLLSGKVSAEKIMETQPRDVLRELFVLECLKLVSRVLGIPKAEAKQILIQEVPKISSTRNINP
jgi:Leucine-rich repeat (LRR) protein